MNKMGVILKKICVIAIAVAVLYSTIAVNENAKAMRVSTTRSLKKGNYICDWSMGGGSVSFTKNRVKLYYLSISNINGFYAGGNFNLPLAKKVQYYLDGRKTKKAVLKKKLKKRPHMLLDFSVNRYKKVYIISA